MPTGSKIPFFGIQRQYQNLKSEILDSVDNVLSTGIVMDGENVDKFESWLCDRTGYNYAIACHSGTQALEFLAFHLLESIKKIPSNKKRASGEFTALIPSMTYIATATAFIKAGWNVEFVDVDMNGVIDIDYVMRLSKNYDTVVPVGLFGAHFINNQLKFQQWVELNLNIPTVIDGAQHWLCDSPAYYQPYDKAETFSSMAISFDPTKNLANFGNGGAILTNKSNIKDYAKQWVRNKHTYSTNSRMSEVDAATLLVKTQYIDAWQGRRRQIAEYWLEKLKNSKLRCLVTEENINNHSLHKFVIDTGSLTLRDSLGCYLNANNIETRIHYKQPLHECPEFLLCNFNSPGMLSKATILSRQVISLPIYPELTDSEVEYIINRVLDHVD